MLRFAFVLFVTFLLLFPTLLVTLVMFIVGIFSKKAAGNIAQGWLRIGSRLLLVSTGSKITAIGVDRIPKDETVLFVSNHRSILDILIAYAYTNKRFAFVAKNNLERTPIVRVFIRYTGGMFLDRNDIKKGMQTILEAIQKVKDGLSIWICPEGTRSKSRDITELLPFKGGSFKIATKSGAKIVPVAINGTGELLELSLPKMIPQSLVIEYGEAVDPAEMQEEDRKRIGDYFADIIRAMLIKNLEIKR